MWIPFNKAISDTSNIRSSLFLDAELLVALSSPKDCDTVI